MQIFKFIQRAADGIHYSEGYGLVFDKRVHHLYRCLDIKRIHRCRLKPLLGELETGLIKVSLVRYIDTLCSQIDPLDEI